MEVKQIAMVCHGANKAYCESIGDTSQLEWENAPEWQRDSAIKGVEFNLANPGALPDAAHKSWFAQKESEGWVYGPVKNPDLLQHPCMVPYDQLPIEQQKKDSLFIAIVHALK